MLVFPASYQISFMMSPEIMTIIIVSYQSRGEDYDTILEQESTQEYLNCHSHILFKIWNSFFSEINQSDISSYIHITALKI